MSEKIPPITTQRSFLTWIKWSGFTIQTFFLVILPLSILLIGVTFGSLALHQEAMRNLVGERDERIARSAAHALGEQLNHRATSIEGLALRTQETTSSNELLDPMGYLQSEFDLGLAFYNRDGTLLAAYSSIDFWNDLDGEFAELLHESLASADTQPQFSEPMFHPQLGEFVVFVFSESSPQSPVAIGAFSITKLAGQTFGEITSTDDQSNSFVVDNKGQLLFLAGPLELSDPPNLHRGVQDALRGESGTLYIMVDSREHVVAFNPVTPTGWALVIEEPWDAVASPLLRFTSLGPLVLVPILVISLGALWFGARQVIQPLKNLEVRSRALAWGDFQPINEPVGGIGEIGHLQEALIHMANRVQIAQRGLRGYIGAITAGQEEERRRLARELHDDTIQSLIALNQKVEFTRRSFADSKTTDSLNEIQTLINLTIQDLRRLTHALRPLYLEDLGLVPALEMLSRETSRDSGIPIQFETQGTEVHLPVPQAIAIFRMVQEGLSNIIRHSRATHASLNLTFDKEKIVLIIADNGQGFVVPESPAEFAPRGHFGLLGIHERAELFGAKLEIQSSLGNGTKLVVTIPTQL